MIRLYVDEPLSENKEIELNENQSHYLLKVMRLKEGDALLLFNGKEGEWKARLGAPHKKSASVLVLSLTRPQCVDADLWLLFSPLKPKRQAFLIEKATELGVACLWPIGCERTSFPKVNLAKMQAHVIEAAEQCGRLTLPFVNPLVTLPKLLEQWSQTRLLLFGDESLTSPPLASLSLAPHKPYAFLVGPEGGFTRQELSLLKSCPYAQGVTLSPHILRAETAALVGISYLQLIIF